MTYEGTRDFLEALLETGDAVTVSEEVDWDQEAAAVGRRLCERDGPAVWFRRVKDYAGEASLFMNPLATWRRVAVALGLPPDTPVPELFRIFEERQGHTAAPVVVGSAPCQEVAVVGEDAVDLHALPAPMLHDGDGGRYVGTWDLVVSRDPETAWTNWGMYRFMIHDRNTLAGFPRPTSHLGKVLRERYVPAGQAMPIAIVIGADPLSHFAAAATYLLGGSEAELAGALRGRGVPVVRCLTSDLQVPAEAEIVIEAEVFPDRVVPEGPYGEYPGYRTGEMGRGIAARVKAVTCRRRPILTVDATGYKDDSSVVTAFSGAVTIKRRLQRHGLPVHDVYVPPEGAVHLAVVSVERGGPEVCREILDVLTSRRALLSKILVVDADVDVFHLDEVLHAFATKCHPGRGIHVARYEGRANTLTPCYSQEERARQAGATVAFDCTWPPDWSLEHEVPVKATFDTIFAPEVRDRVLGRWPDLGLETRSEPAPARRRD